MFWIHTGMHPVAYVPKKFLAKTFGEILMYQIFFEMGAQTVEIPSQFSEKSYRKTITYCQ